MARATARADELSSEELRAGALRLTDLVARYAPAFVAVVGVTAYRVAFDRRGARIGPVPERLAGARLWVLPNPSGLNAGWSLDRISAEFRTLREAAGSPAA